MYFFLLVSLISFQVSADDWWSTIRSEDEKNYFYVGMAEGKRPVSVLQDEAFNKAMGELIREHFGMSIQVNESAVEELQKQQFNVTTKQSSAPLFIKGVIVGKTREKDLDDEGTRVYVQIQADKKSVAEAIRNQTTKPGNDSLNTFGESHDSKIDITVKTHPPGALIHFSHLDRRFTLQGQGDARFFLPRGRYQMVVSHPGYAVVTRELKLEEQGSEETIILDELSGSVKLEVSPDDARITYEGEKLSSGEIRLPVNKIHKFKISHPDFFPQEVEFMLESPETYHKTVKLEPRPSTLSYEVYPYHAQVTIDGKPVTLFKGKTNVDPGKKKVVISAPGYFDYEDVVYAGTNREYPLKVVRLQIDDQNMPPSNKGLAYRIELNPFFTDANVGYGGLGVGLHVEYYYLSLGAGANLTSYSKTQEGETNAQDKEIEKNISDAYVTARLISPSFGRFKFLASATAGQYSRSAVNKIAKTEIWSEQKKFTGVGGGVRFYITPRWSFQAEYFGLSVVEKKTEIKNQEQRVIAGFGYEF